MTKLNLELMEMEFLDFLKVLEFGGQKHGNYNWLQPEGKKSSHDDMHASMFRHLAESSAGHRADAETGLDPLLHLASRALMMYTRIKRGVGELKVHNTTTVEVLDSGEQVLVSRPKKG